MLEFFESLPTTTSGSTTSTATTASATQSSTITPRTSAKTRYPPYQKWSIASIEVMETVITDCQKFDKARNCLLKYMYGDKWVSETNCSDTTTDVVTTTVLPESTIKTTVIPTIKTTVIPTIKTTVVPESKPDIAANYDVTTLPQTLFTIFPNAVIKIGGNLILISLPTIENLN